MDTNKIAKQIKKELGHKFPGAKFNVVVTEDSFHYDLEPGSCTEFYYLYPGLSIQEADYQVLEDIRGIFAKYLGSAKITHFVRN